MTIFVSHRGRGTQFPEQTRMAFAAAIEQGVTMLEVDLRVTRDRVLVLAHNKSFQRLNGDERIVNALDWEVVAGFRDGDGNGVLSFEELAREFSDYRWIVDIKERSAPQVIACLREWASRHGRPAFLEENCHFLVWSRAHRRLLHTAFPRARDVLTANECLLAAVWAMGSGGLRGWCRAGDLLSIPPSLLRLAWLDARMVASIARVGYLSMLYLPRAAWEVERALFLGVDYVLTDFPEHANAYMDKDTGP